MRLFGTVAVDRPVEPGIRIWLQRWFTSMAIVLGGSALILATPIRDPGYGTWASVFTAHGVFGDQALPTLLDPLAWYLIIMPPLLMWHLLDVRYITRAPSTFATARCR